MDRYLSQLNNIFLQYEEIKLVYLFGSQATKKTTPLSDFDFALYLDPNIDIQKEKEITLKLIYEISLVVKNNNIEIVSLNKSASSLLKFNILKEGRLIYQKPPYKVLVEPTIYNEYFDFQTFMQSHQRMPKYLRFCRNKRSFPKILP